jgi:hypothetical protein
MDGSAPRFSIWRLHHLLLSTPFGAEAGLETPLGETQALTLEVDPAEPGVTYRILVGDYPSAPTHVGRQKVEWSENTYLDSARGATVLTLQSLAMDGRFWTTCVRVTVHVLPSKATEQGYQTMLADLSALATGLVFDLAAKSRTGLARLGASSRRGERLPAQSELVILEAAWASLSGSLQQVLSAPERRLAPSRAIRTWTGAEMIHPADLPSLLASGVDPRHVSSAQGRALELRTVAETDVTREHAFIREILSLARRRAEEFALRAQTEMDVIEDERPFREVGPQGRRSLYEEVDVPRLEVLADAVRRSEHLARQLKGAISRLPAGRTEDLWALAQPSPVFLNVPAYNRFWRTALDWVRRSWVVLEFGEQERLKPTWRMYEQWVFLSLADGLRRAGLVVVGQRDFAQVLSSGRFSVDLQRGASLVFSDSLGRKLRLTYEPWILPLDLARSRGASVYRGGTNLAAWCPDILMEAFPRGPAPEGPDYAIVIDAKYSKRSAQYMEGLEKYLKIRSIGAGRQVVRQVWAASPGGAGIEVDDEAVSWTYAGPDVERDEQIMGRLAMPPGDAAAPALTNWIDGTLAYLGYDPGR